MPTHLIILSLQPATFVITCARYLLNFNSLSQTPYLSTPMPCSPHFIPALEPIIIISWSILYWNWKIHDGLRETPEERDVVTTFPCFWILDPEPTVFGLAIAKEMTQHTTHQGK